MSIDLNHIVRNEAPIGEGLGGGRGGGIYATDSTALTISGNRIEGNVVTPRILDDLNRVGGGGGGIYVNASEALITDNDIVGNNRSGRLGAVVGSYGGGIAVRDDLSSIRAVTIRSNLISGNGASYAGGGVAVIGLRDDRDALLALGEDNIPQVIANGLRGLQGGVPLCSLAGNTITDNVVDSGDHQGRGGGVWASGLLTRLTLFSNRIAGNRTSGDGGGVCAFNGATVDGRDNRVLGNTAGDDGGGASHGTKSVAVWTDNVFDGNRSKNNGGGLHASVGSAVTIRGNTISNNFNTVDPAVPGHHDGGGIYLRNAALTSLGGNTITGNRVTGDGGGIASLSDDDATVRGGGGITLAAGDRIADNQATGHGGGVAVEDLSGPLDVAVDIRGVVFQNNRALGTVGGIPTAGLYVAGRGLGAVRDSVFYQHAGAAVTAVGVRGTNRGSPNQPPLRIVDNVVFDNHTGLNLSAAEVRVSGNTFNGNRDYHVNVAEASLLRIADNTFVAGGRTTVGVRVDTSEYSGRDLSINGNNFTGGHRWAVLVVSPTPRGSGYEMIDAEGNWWGDDGGPNDPPSLDRDYNPNPAGETVGDGVDYRRWRRSPVDR